MENWLMENRLMGSLTEPYQKDWMWKVPETAFRFLPVRMVYSMAPTMPDPSGSKKVILTARVRRMVLGWHRQRPNP